MLGGPWATLAYVNSTRVGVVVPAGGAARVLPAHLPQRASDGHPGCLARPGLSTLTARPGLSWRLPANVEVMTPWVVALASRGAQGPRGAAGRDV